MKALSPPTMAAPFGRYSHGVAVEAGHRWLRSSGQLALAQDGSVPEGARAQADLIFANLGAILAEGGMGPDQVVHLSAYVTDRAYMGEYMQARDVFLAGVETLPSSTLFIVSGFTRPEFLVEIELWAAAPAPE